MTILRELALVAAEHLPIWRDAAVLLLAAVVIGCLFLYAELLEP